MTLSDRLSQITSRLDAATPGPWKVVEGMYSDRAGIDIALTEHSCCFSHKNAELVAHAPSDLRFLTAALKAAVEALEFYEKPESIEPYLTEGKEKCFGRPGIKMGFYAPSREALAAISALAGGES